MAAFSFDIRLNADAYEAEQLDLPDEGAAIRTGLDILQAKVRSRPVVSATVAVAAGALPTAPAPVDWLGQWVWTGAGGWRWETAEE
jgi:hypothetical protein